MEDLYEDGVEVYILVDGLFQSGCLFAGLWRLLTWWETGTRNENVSCLSFGLECNVQSIPRDDGNTVFYIDIYIYMPLYDSDEDAI
jgi:hypothetical protein